MADQTESSTTVDAAPERVMAVIEDFAAYPEWAGEVRSADVIEVGNDGRPAQVRFVMDAGVIKDEYTLRYEWSGADRVTWSLVEGRVLTELDGSYELGATPDGGTEVTYRLSVGIALPMLGMMRRRAERVIIDRALAGLKKRAES
ncbi:MAG: SRPBCC family protein [Actinomycetota bacterium]|nr:SRPBCC family protein [Actinomycetota bacterium]